MGTRRHRSSARLGRQVLWNGNIEPPLWTVFTDPEHIVRWACRHTTRPPNESLSYTSSALIWSSSA